MNVPDSTKIAAVRAMLSALVVGAMSAVTVWATTDDPKAVAVAGLTAGLGILAARLGVEGYIDRPK